MKTLRQLDKDIDSIKKIPDSLIKRTRTDLKSYIRFTKYKDSVTINKQPAIASTKIELKKVNSFSELIPDSLKNNVYDNAAAIVASVRSLMEITSNEYYNSADDVTLHKIEWHKKLSVSVACIVLFFIGAPLGSIIRKGGLGLPLVVALIFFLIFYLLNIFGEKFTKDHVLDPVTGMWLPIIILSPVGFFLTYKAMHDSQLFNKEYYYRVIRKITSAAGTFISFLKKV
jgi:lipopolysaccharide export system permease protein